MAYQSANAASQASYGGHAVAPHYSPAGSVSSFHFSNPHVTYSNLGLLSQVIGKGYSAPQAHPSQQVAYATAPASQHYVASAPQVQYQSTPQVQYQSAPQVQYQSAPQVQYLTHAAPQYTGATHQYSSAGPQVQYVQQSAHSAPQYYYSSAPKTYNTGYSH